MPRCLWKAHSPKQIEQKDCVAMYKKRRAAFVFSYSFGHSFCFAPVIFSGTRFGPHFDYSCIKRGTKFGSHFWFPFSFFSRSTFIKKRIQNQFSQQYFCRALLYQSTLCMLWVAYLIAIGYGVDEAVWINVDETPIPHHVGGRHGWKSHPVQELRDQMDEKASLHPHFVRHQWVGGFKNLQKSYDLLRDAIAP